MEISFGTDRLCGRCRDVGINLAPVPFVDIDRWQSRMQLGPPPHRPEAHNLLSCRYFRRPIQAGFGARNADPVLHFSRCSTDVSRFSAEACASLGISPTIAILVVGKRHHVQYGYRFFPMSERDVDRSRNCKAGTLSSATSLIPPRFLPSSARRVARTMWTGNTEEPVAIRLRTGRNFAPLCFLPSESIDDWMTYYYLYYIAVNIHNYIAMELNA
ncbi:hypothetical protein K438DRAFT_2003092 [Mycena galopus ATCC 62051]|nr:hypothetical protein K438DRAFT_2003092 [Mycena galopus ATCC 62051]